MVHLRIRMPKPSLEIYICPFCHSSLCESAGALTCDQCDRSYPITDRIPDFVQGTYYDSFELGGDLSLEAQEGLRHEDAGAESRTLDFYLPLINQARHPLKPRSDSRVLDCGCGSGLSVDLLNQAGISAWGNEPSSLRRWQWANRVWRDKLFIADGSSLPIPDGFFDVVLASGVLEHIGVTESRGTGYTVRRLASRDEARRRFLAELLRVTRSGGTVWLDFPNGAFPIDFWHTDRPGQVRFHRLDEGFLPTAKEVREYVRELSPLAKVQFRSPLGRLAFRRARMYWYGQLLWIPVTLGFVLMTHPLFRWLASSRVNPFLVVEIRRP